MSVSWCWRNPTDATWWCMYSGELLTTINIAEFEWVSSQGFFSITNLLVTSLTKLFSWEVLLNQFLCIVLLPCMVIWRRPFGRLIKVASQISRRSQAHLIDHYNRCSQRLLPLIAKVSSFRSSLKNRPPLRCSVEGAHYEDWETSGFFVLAGLKCKMVDSILLLLWNFASKSLWTLCPVACWCLVWLCFYISWLKTNFHVKWQ